jgi:hypothetical protein
MKQKRKAAAVDSGESESTKKKAIIKAVTIKIIMLLHLEKFEMKFDALYMKNSSRLLRPIR